MMFSYSMKTFSWILLVGAIPGCCSLPDNGPIAAFERKHPSEFRQFVYLNPVDLDTYKMLSSLYSGLYDSTLDSISQRFSDTPGLTNYIANQRRHGLEDLQEAIAGYQRMVDLSAGGGVVCQYERTNEKTKDVGFLVIKNGEILTNEPMIIQMLPGNHLR